MAKPEAASGRNRATKCFAGFPQAHHDKIAPVGGAEDRDQGTECVGTTASLRVWHTRNVKGGKVPQPRTFQGVRPAMRRQEALTPPPYRLHVTSQLHGVPTLTKSRDLVFRQSFQKLLTLKFLTREVLKRRMNMYYSIDRRGCVHFGNTQLEANQKAREASGR